MFDGSTPTPEPAPFAVGYGNGYGYESLPAVKPTRPTSARRDPSPRWGEGAIDRASSAGGAPTAALVSSDPDATVAIPTPVAVAAPMAVPAAPSSFLAHPAGAAHPRRRFGRGLVLASLALVVAGTGIGAVALGSTGDVRPAAAAASASSDPTARSTVTIGDQLGRGVDPLGPGATSSVPVPASVIESPTITRVPPTAVPTTTAPPTTTPPTTAPPTTAPPTTAPPTTTPPTTTAPAGPTFTTLNVPSTVDCPTPNTQDATATFSWSAPGATKVTLSIDGPGIYRTYNGPNGTETVNVPCSSAHTYLFTAYSATNAVTTTSFTVTPG